MVVKEFLEDIPDKEERESAFRIWKWVKRAAIGLVATVGLAQSCYTIPSNSEGVVQRFGAYSHTATPGFNFKFPFGIDKVTKVPLRTVQTEEFGFRTVQGTFMSADQIFNLEDKKELTDLIINSGQDVMDPKVMDTKRQASEIVRSEYLMLTGDLNMADVEWIVQYDIKNAKDYLFNIRSPVKTLRDCSLSAMKQLCGNRSVDEVITIGREEIGREAKKDLQALLDKCNSGINIVAVKVQAAHAPTQVRDSFNAVSRAMQQKEARINEAKQLYNKEVPLAKGLAQEEINNAEGYASKIINEAKGDVLKFWNMYKEYERNPEITKARIFYDTMEQFLPKIAGIQLIEQKGAEGGVLMRYDIKNLIKADQSGGNK